MIHKHHIIPKYMGGSNDPSNIVELTVLEHADAHNLLYHLHGNRQDRLAELGLLGYYKKQDIIKELLKLNGKLSWKNGMTEKRRALYSSKRMKDHGRWLAKTYGIYKDSETQSKYGKIAAKSARHPNNNNETCEHCNRTMNIGHIRRYHGDNCKLREVE